jgi:hypothetical protein
LREDWEVRDGVIKVKAKIKLKKERFIFITSKKEVDVLPVHTEYRFIRQRVLIYLSGKPFELESSV